MGHCTSDIYKTAKREYGQIFQTLVVQQQSLIKFKQWTRGRQQEYDSKLTSKKDSLYKQIEQIQESLSNNFSQARVNLEAELPYGVTSFEQMKKTTLQNLLDLEVYKRKILEVKAHVDSETAKNKDIFHKKAQQIIKKIEQESKIDHQKLKPFHDLPEEKKKFIFDKGAKDFESQIKTRLSELQKTYENQLNADIPLQKLSNEVSLSDLNNIVTQSKSHFNVEVTNIIGSNLDSNIRV